MKKNEMIEFILENSDKYNENELNKLLKVEVEEIFNLMFDTYMFDEEDDELDIVDEILEEKKNSY